MKKTFEKSWKYAIYGVGLALLATMLWSCKYKKIEDYREGLASVQAFNGKWGYIDENKNEVIPCQYDETNNFSYGYAVVKKEEAYGIIDKSGKEVLACNYDRIDYFSDSMQKIILKGKHGVFDLAEGQVSIPAKYDEIADGFYQRDSLIMIKMNGKFGFIDLNDKEIIPCKYDEICSRDFNRRLKSARTNYQNGYEETQSNEFDRRFTLVRVNNKYGVINKSGVEVFPCIYDNIDFFIKDLIELKLNDKVGFFDIKGKEIIPLKYDRLIQFRNDSIVMASGNKITLFNFSGKVINNGTLTQ